MVIGALGRFLGYLAFGLALDVASGLTLENPLGGPSIFSHGSTLSTLGSLPRDSIHHAPSSPFPQIVLLFQKVYFIGKLEDKARYAALLLAPAEGFGLRPRLFLSFGPKKRLFCCLGLFLEIFGVQ